MNSINFKIIIKLLIPLFLVFFGCKGNNIDSRIDHTEISIIPSPASTECQIELVIIDPAQATIVISDIYGREVMKVLDNKLLQPGINQFHVDVSRIPTGVYDCVCSVGSEVSIQEFGVIR